ncbi:hypothetical protein ACKWTF_016520 [Chironomus riparius]
MFNKISGVLQKVWNMEYDLTDWKDLDGSLNRNIIINTNNSSLLLRNICYCLFQENQQLFNTKSIFMAPKCLQNEEIFKQFNEILTKERNLDHFFGNSEQQITRFKREINSVDSDVSMENDESSNIIFNNFSEMSKNNFNSSEYIPIIVDCSEESGSFLNQYADILSRQTANFIFVLKNGYESDELVQILEKKMGIRERITIDYSWNDLTIESQDLLLQREISLQNSPKILLKTIENVSADQHLNNETFQNIVDSQLLNLLMDKSTEIHINKNNIQELKSDEFFEAIFQTRNFVKNFSKEIEKKLSIDEFESQKSTKSFNNIEIDEQNESVKFTEVIKISESISLSDQLDEVQNQKYVIISDTAGTGKSWMLKNIGNILQNKYPDRWQTYIDLNQFTDEFKSFCNENFVDFMIKKIIKPKEKFEEKIFKQLYKNGKVVILFDGFDEICSECTDPMIKVLESFEHNNGNQLWITTRDYFQVSIQEKLKIDVVYKLDEFPKDYGENLISLSWILMELKEKSSKIDIKSLNQILKQNPKKLEHYQQKAKSLLNKIPKINNRKIGYPLFYKIVSEIYKDKLDDEIIMTLYSTYKEYTIKQYKIWSNEKGKIWNEDSIRVQMDGVNFVLVHQFHAMESLFPKITVFCDLKKENIGWPEIQIVNFGLINKNVFIHETFCEFYAAEFVLRVIEKELWETHEDFFKFFISLLTEKKFDVVRMFINEAWNSISLKLELNIKNFADQFDRFIDGNQSFSKIYSENLENLALFLINVFNCLKYNKVKNILFKNIISIINKTKNSELFLKFQEFYVNFLQVNDLKLILLNLNIINYIAESSLNHEVVKHLNTKILQKLDAKFMKQILMPTNHNNLLLTIIDSRRFTAQKFQTFCSMMEEYLGKEILMSLFWRNTDSQITNIMHKIIFKRDEELLKTVWKTIKEILNSSEKPLSKLLPQLKCNKMRTPLHDAAFSNKVQFFVTLWELLLDTFINREELKEFVLQKDVFGNSFIHMVVALQSADIIELNFKVLKDNFNDHQYKEIINSYGYENRNLLQKATEISKDISVHQKLWKIVRESCDSSKDFIKFIIEQDNSENNVLFMAMNFPTCDIFNTMIEELEQITEHLEIKKLLKLKNGYGQNLLHKSLRFNQSIEMQIGLWNILYKYLELKEIQELVNDNENYECNILHYAVTYSSLEITAYTLGQIKNVLNENELKSYLLIPGYKRKSLYESALQNELSQMADWILNEMTSYCAYY